MINNLKIFKIIKENNEQILSSHFLYNSMSNATKIIKQIM